MLERIPMTPEGYEKLKEELDRLIKIERPAIIKAIVEARAHGDLSENAEYHAAREKQSFIEGRIQELQAKLSRAYVVDASKINQNKVIFGVKVKVLDLDTEEERQFHLVGPDEVDVKNGKISITSPVGKALIGKQIGDEVTVKAPAKIYNFQILSINFE